MYYLIYTSQSRRDWNEASLKDLLMVSNRNNQLKHITGMLIFLKDRFIQILEGEQKDVKEVFNRIAKDDRHEKVNVLLEGKTTDRLFSGWFMGFKSLNESEFQQMSGFKSLDDFFQSDSISDHSHPALIFLKLFYERNIRDMAYL